MVGKARPRTAPRDASAPCHWFPRTHVGLYTMLFAWSCVGGGTGCSLTAHVADDVSNGVAGGITTAGAAGEAGATATGGAAAGGTPITNLNPIRVLTPTELAIIENSDCRAGAIEPEARKARLELLVDVTSSMNEPAPGVDQSKWAVLRDALLEAIPGVNGPGLPARTAVGLFFYPNLISDSISTVPVDPSTCLNTWDRISIASLGDYSPGTQRERMRVALSEVTLGQSTPTLDAYKYVLNGEVLTTETQSVSNDNYILLITDGMPTLQEGCSNPSGQYTDVSGDAIVVAVSSANAKGVRTFVIGLPGSTSARKWLTMAAFLGGSAALNCNPDSEDGPYCHQDLSATSDLTASLRDALRQVSSVVSACRFEVPTKFAGGNQAVEFGRIVPIITFGDGTTVLVGRDPTGSSACTDGYQIGEGQIELCRQTCAWFSSDAWARIEFVFGCSEQDLSTLLGHF